MYSASILRYSNSRTYKYIVLRSISSSVTNPEHRNTSKHEFVLPPTYPSEVPGPSPNIPSRTSQVKNLSSSTIENPYDILIIGGGATGVGCALDATTRKTIHGQNQNLRVACIERGDFSSETSSRSTKLIWAGIRYLATASASLLNTQLLTNPINTIREFASELQMVINCHRERRYMLEKQKHLCNWVPIGKNMD